MPETLTPGDGQDALASIKHAWERSDPDAIMERFADDAEYRTDPFEPPLVGANAVREHWNAVAASQVHVEFDAERIWVSGRSILASWHAAFTLRASGDRVRVRGFSTLELDDDGKIARMRDWSVSREVGRDGRFAPDATPQQPGEGQDG